MLADGGLERKAVMRAGEAGLTASIAYPAAHEVKSSTVGEQFDREILADVGQLTQH